MKEANEMHPLVLAYIGDAVYELYIRVYLTSITNSKPHELHIKAISYVKAKAQAEILNKIMNVLTEEEKDVIRRGRNAKNHHIPKNADLNDYMYATAFEALIGYLYLTNKERMEEILKLCIE